MTRCLRRLPSVILTAALLAGAPADAAAAPGGVAAPPSATLRRAEPVRGHHHRRPSAFETRVIRIERWVEHETLPLRWLGRLGRRFDDYRIDAVDVRIRRRPRGTRLYLITDGRVADRRRASRPTTHLRPRPSSWVGHALGTVKLHVDGRAYIDHIRVRLLPRRPVHRDRLHRPFRPRRPDWR